MAYDDEDRDGGSPGEVTGPSGEVAGLAATYLRAVVGVLWRGRWIAAARHPWADEGGYYVVTAWNPGDQRFDVRDNRRRNDDLRRDLRALQGDDGNVLPALGADVHSPHAEESWAVAGVGEHAVTRLAAGYGQVAVFRFHGSVQTVVACTSTWRVGRNAAGDDLRTAPAFRDAPLAD